VRDFDPANDRYGSNSTELAAATRPFMSAMLPTATELMRRKELSRCANAGQSAPASATCCLRNNFALWREIRALK